MTSAYFRSSANGLAGDGDDYFLYNTTSGALSYDADGNGMGVAVQFATLTTKPAISAGDFIIASSYNRGRAGSSGFLWAPESLLSEINVINF